MPDKVNDVVMNRATLADAELSACPGIQLDQMTLVVSTALAASALTAQMAADAVGFDTKSKPTFRKGQALTGPHLLQFATDAHAYLFPISRTGDVRALQEIFESHVVLKVGFGRGNDRSALKSRLSIEPNRLLDLGEKLSGPQKDWHPGATSPSPAMPGPEYSGACYFSGAFSTTVRGLPLSTMSVLINRAGVSPTFLK